MSARSAGVGPRPATSPRATITSSAPLIAQAERRPLCRAPVRRARSRCRRHDEPGRAWSARSVPGGGSNPGAGDSRARAPRHDRDDAPAERVAARRDHHAPGDHEPLGALGRIEEPAVHHERGPALPEHAREVARHPEIDDAEARPLHAHREDEELERVVSSRRGHLGGDLGGGVRRRGCSDRRRRGGGREGGRDGGRSAEHRKATSAPTTASTARRLALRVMGGGDARLESGSAILAPADLTPQPPLPPGEGEPEEAARALLRAPLSREGEGG